MELVFEKVGNRYVAEFKADNDFNLHVERTKLGTLEVYQKGVEEGEYDFAWNSGISARKVIDYDFAALVYPKWIKVVSGSEVVSANVNFNEGGGSGSGSGSSDGVTMEYYHIDYDNTYLSEIISTKGMTWLNGYVFVLFNIIKYEDKFYGITSTGSGDYVNLYTPENNIKALDVACMNVPIAISGSVLQGDTWVDSIKNYFYEITDWSWLVPITKEEFFDFVNNYE